MKMKFDTKVIHAAIKPDSDTGSIVTPMHQTATYAMEKVGKDKGYDYTRSANPTRAIMEYHLAALDNGKYGIAFASGMAAIDSCLKLLKSGDHIICSDDVYGGTYRLFDQLLVNYDLHFSFVDTSFPHEVENAITPKTKMIWVETPTNPLLKDKISYTTGLFKLVCYEIYNSALTPTGAGATSSAGAGAAFGTTVAGPDAPSSAAADAVNPVSGTFIVPDFISSNIRFIAFIYILSG